MGNFIDLTKVRNMSTLVPRVMDTEYPIYLFEFGGAIGSGKSETAKKVIPFLLKCLGGECRGDRAGGFNVVELREDINSDANKKAIDDFYKGGGSSPSELERQICGRRLQMLLDVIKRQLEHDVRPLIILSDRCIEDDLLFIKELINKNKNLEQERRKLINIHDNISTFVVGMNVFDSAILHTTIYLEPSPDEALARIRKRGRPNEQQIDKATLWRLTGESDKLICNDVVSIDNGHITPIETATIAFYEILKRLRLAPRILVSLYGIPGAGKSYMAKEFGRLLSVVNPVTMVKTFATVLDESEQSDIVEEQRKIYEDEHYRMSADEIQNWIDNRRLRRFKEIDTETYPLVITDIGPRTSQIFRNVTECSTPDFCYENTVSEMFDVCMNVVVNAEGLDVVRQHIAERGRPGEYEYFTESRLRRIDEEIRECVCVANVHIPATNRYDKLSAKDLFHGLLHHIRNVLEGWFE